MAATAATAAEGKLRALNVNVVGDGKSTVVLAHGFGTDQSAWKKVLPYLQQAYRVVLFDLACAGSVDPSFFDFRRYASLDGFVDDLIDILDALSVRCCTIVGHSVSALIAILASIRRPDLFSKLVLLCASPRYMNEEGLEWGVEEKELVRAWKQMEENYAAWVNEVAPLAVGADVPETVQEFSRAMLSMRPDITLFIYRYVFHIDLRGILGLVRVPCCLIQTARDCSVPASVSSYLARNLGCDTTMEILDTEGHLPHLSAPALLVPALLRAISRYTNEEGMEWGFEEKEMVKVWELMEENYVAWVNGVAPLVVGADIPEVVQEFSRTLFNMRPDITLFICRYIFNIDIREILGFVRVPCCLIQTARDRSIPASVSSYLARNLGCDTAMEILDTEGPPSQCPCSPRPCPPPRHIQMDTEVPVPATLVLAGENDDSAFSDCNSDRSGEFPASSRRLRESCSIESSDDAIRRLVADLCSGCVEDQKQAAMAIRLLAKHKQDNRLRIARAGAVKPLLTLISSSDPQLLEHGVTAILNLSLCDENKEEIAAAGAVRPLVRALRSGTPAAKENAACALLRLSQIEMVKVAIGRSGAIGLLVDMLEKGSLRGKKDASTALYSLCSVKENKTRAVDAGIMRPLVEIMSDLSSKMVDKCAFVLNNLVTVAEARSALVEEGGIPVLVEMVEAGSQRQKEIAVTILVQICEDSVACRGMVAREGAIPPLVALSQSGTPRCRQKAGALVEMLRRPRYGNGDATTSKVSV